MSSSSVLSIFFLFTVLVSVLLAQSYYDSDPIAYDDGALLEEILAVQDPHLSEKRGETIVSNEHPIETRNLPTDGSMPGVLRFGKRGQAFVRFGKRYSSSMEKKEMPGVLRFGKRNEKKSVPGVLRFGKRSDMPGVLRFGKKSVPGVLRFGRK